MITITTRRSLAALAMASTALLAACGGGGGSSDSSSGESNDAKGLEQATRGFVEEVVDGDYGAAYERLSNQCQSRISKDEFTEQTETALEYAKTLGFDLGDAKIVSVNTRNIENGRGEAELVMELQGEEQGAGDWSEFLYEDGTWRTDDCGGMVGTGS